MARIRTNLKRAAAILPLLGGLFGIAAAPPEARSNDRLAAEIDGWSAFVQSNHSIDENWTQVKAVTEPMLENARKALDGGRRLLALLRLAAVRHYLSGERYVGGRPARDLKDNAAFEAEWTRMGGVLREDLASPSPAALEGVRPAAVRAIGEAALPQVKVYYEASLDFGRNTMARSGFFYIGVAQAQRELASLCRTLGEPSSGAAPRLRPLAADLDRLEGDLLAAYRPPASIDRHMEFITASSTLKEARELDAAGLRYGALLRYLQAALRVAPLRSGGSKPLDAPALARRLEELGARLSPGGVDHSIGRLFLEAAQANVEGRGARQDRRHGAGGRRGRPPALFRRARARASGGAKARRASHGHAGALALHLKPLRSGKFAGTERRRGL